MKTVFISFVLGVLFIAVSCSNSVTKINDNESVTDNNTIADNEQNDTESVDKEIQDLATDEEADNELPDEDTIGSGCSQNDDCSANEFCMKETGSCDNSVIGTCEKRSDDCYIARVAAPVCGCDDYSYSSFCWAHAEGVNVKHDGQCEGDVICWNNEACETGEFCEKKIGVCDMSSGVCRKKPAAEDCPPPQVYHPFCGCDLYEYMDICYSSSGGIPIKHMGECNGPEDSKFEYFFGANAESPSGSLKVVMSEADIREFQCNEQHQEDMINDGNSLTVTINFKNKEMEHAQLQFTVLVSDVTGDIFPFGMGLGYQESYLKVYDTSENVIADMQGVVMIYDYSPLFMSSQIPTLDVRGINLWVED